MKKLALGLLLLGTLGSTAAQAYDCHWRGYGYGGRLVSYGNNSGHGDCKVKTISYGVVLIKEIK